MLILMLSTSSGISVARRLKTEGHDVYIYLDRKDISDISDDPNGWVPELGDYVEFLKKNRPDFVFADTTGFGSKMEEISRRFGVPILCGSRFADKLEFDRLLGLNVMEASGIRIPPTFEFKSIERAIKFLKSHPDRYVIKVTGDQVSSYTTHVSHDPNDGIEMLEHFRDEQLLNKNVHVILQKFIDGFEISTEIWLSHGVWIPGLTNHTIEEKKFLTGNLGPTVGCAGSVIWYPGAPNFLIDNILNLLPILQAENYTGSIDLNSIVDRNGNIYGLEFTPRFGYIGIESLCMLYDDSLADLFYAIAVGDFDFLSHVSISPRMFAGINVTIPPYPTSDLPSKLPKDKEDYILAQLMHRSSGIEIRGYEGFEDACFWGDARYEPRSKKIYSSGLGFLVTVCATGDTMYEALGRMYGRADALIIPEKQYRIDIGKRAEDWFTSWIDMPEVVGDISDYYYGLSTIDLPDGNNVSVYEDLSNY